jgi:hypothetical protein
MGVPFQCEIRDLKETGHEAVNWGELLHKRTTAAFCNDGEAVLLLQTTHTNTWLITGGKSVPPVTVRQTDRRVRAVNMATRLLVVRPGIQIATDPRIFSPLQKFLG